MDYTVSEAKLQQLDALIDVGGHLPSAVSDALAEAQIAQANGNAAALTEALDAAIAANIRGGKAWSAAQLWHDEVEKSGAEQPPPEQPPRPPVGGTLIDPVPNDGVGRTFGPLFENSPATTHAGGDGRFSWTLASGSGWCETYVNGKLVSNGNGTAPNCDVKAGDAITMKSTNGAPPQNVTYYLNK